MSLVKYNWYKTTYKDSFSSLLQSISDLEYSESLGVGFEVYEITKKSVFAFFIERTVVVDSIEHPSGEVEEMERVSYTKFFFDISYIGRGTGLCRIENAPRSLKSFVRLLAEVSGKGFSIDKLVYDTESLFLDVVSGREITRYVTEKLSVSSISFSESSAAKIQLISKGDAYQDLIEKYPKGSYKLDRIRVVARLEGSTEAFELTSSGAAYCADSFKLVIENALEKVVRSPLQ